MRILIAEDDPALSLQTQRTLDAAGFVSNAVHDGKRALEAGLTRTHDAALLDLGLPGIDGASILRTWRSAGIDIPILVLTARGKWSDKAEVFDAGADDYLVKPFRQEEVVARLRALLRRVAGKATPILSCGEVSIDVSSERVLVAGKPIELTPKEFRILSWMMHHKDEIIPRERLEARIDDGLSEIGSNVLDVLVGRIRKKLGVPLIVTLRGRGYRLAPGDGEEEAEPS
jgi:two-component system OmpR family response regulator